MLRAGFKAESSYFRSWIWYACDSKISIVGTFRSDSNISLSYNHTERSRHFISLPKEHGKGEDIVSQGALSHGIDLDYKKAMLMPTVFFDPYLMYILFTLEPLQSTIMDNASLFFNHTLLTTNDQPSATVLFTQTNGPTSTTSVPATTTLSSEMQTLQFRRLLGAEEQHFQLFVFSCGSDK